MNASPLVLCLTNTVAANFTANVLLAVGAKPAMLEEPEEAAELAAVADAVLVNVGTLTVVQTQTMRAAVKVCAANHKPWVLDPVACHVLAFRRQFVKWLISQKPSLIRGNHSEIDFLLGTVPVLKKGTVPILSTGETDFIYCSNRGTVPDEPMGTVPDEMGSVPVSGGGAMLQTVTATGCAQGAVCAAFLGWGQSPEEACLSASRLMKRAGEVAISRASGPGTFKVALLDALYELSPIRGGRRMTDR